MIEPYGLQGSFLTFRGVTGLEPAHGFTYPQRGWGLFCLLNYTPLPRRIAADEEAAQEGEAEARKSSRYKCRHLP